MEQQDLQQATVEPSLPPKPRRARRVLAFVLTAVAAALVSSAVTVLVLVSRYKEIAPVAELAEWIRGYYYYNNEEQPDLVNGALHGVADALEDKYAVYYTGEEYAALTQSQSGNYIGVGVMVAAWEDGGFTITEVFKDTPAFEAGVLAGDKLIEINGTSYEGLGLNDFLDHMGHEDGDTNNIVVLRGEEKLTFELIMRQVYSPYVHSRMLDNETGYIQITGFHGLCVEETKTALEELSALGMKRLVLDLRDNPGGSLSDVCDIAELFLPEDTLITSVKNAKGNEHNYYTHAEGTTLPMAVLVNENSASASELLSGALQAHGRAWVVGVTTFGKGIVQSYFHMVTTDGVAKFTTEAYFTPAGVCVQGVGITPDEVVELEEEYKDYSIALIPEGEDSQLLAAIEYLKHMED